MHVNRRLCYILAMAMAGVWLFAVSNRTSHVQNLIKAAAIDSQKQDLTTTKPGDDTVLVEPSPLTIEARTLDDELGSTVTDTEVVLDNDVIEKEELMDLSLVEFSYPLPGVADRSGRFTLHPFYQLADTWENLRSRKVCLGTQSSVDRLHWLTNASEVWTGHISVTVFGPAQEFHLAEMAINFLRRCSSTIKDRVTFHLVSLMEHPPKPITTKISPDLLQCSNIEASLKNLATQVLPPAMKFWRETLRYPQNTMRNWAKAGCNSEKILMVDIDMIPSPNMADEVEAFFSDSTDPLAQCQKCVFIVPTYEINTAVGRFPENKQELVSWTKTNEARVFHVSFWPRSCRSSKLEEWEKIPQDNKTEVAYNITKIEAQYEPIYIGPASVPPYDERFVGYGHDRYTQFYEMYLANYTFHILNNPFTSHWEFQDESQRPAWRRKQRANGLLQAWRLAREMVFKYGRDPVRFEPYMRQKVTFHVKKGFIPKSDVPLGLRRLLKV